MVTVPAFLAATTDPRKLAAEGLGKLRWTFQAAQKADQYLGAIAATPTDAGQAAECIRKACGGLSKEGSLAAQKAALQAIAGGVSGPAAVAIASVGTAVIARLKDQDAETFGHSLLQILTVKASDTVHLGVARAALEERSVLPTSSATSKQHSINPSLFGQRALRCLFDTDSAAQFRGNTYHAGLAVIAAGGQPEGYRTLAERIKREASQAEQEFLDTHIFDRKKVDHNTNHMDVALKTQVFADLAVDLSSRLQQKMQVVERVAHGAPQGQHVVKGDGAIQIGTLRIPKNSGAA